MNSHFKSIRIATYRDAPAIKLLMEGFDGGTTLSILIHQLEMAFGQTNHQVLVYEEKKEIAGFAVVNFLPQLATEQPLALISALSADETGKRHGFDRFLEEYITEEAKKRNCKNVLALGAATCHQPDGRFYLQQGYQECPEYFIKNLVYEK